MPVISEKRDLVLNVILTVVTAGIFGLFWLYEILTDLESKGGQGKFDKMAHVLLCLIPIVGWILAAQTMAQQWDVVRQRSEREAEDWNLLFIILGVVCPVGLLALNVTLSDNFGDGPEPIDPVKAALDAKDPNAQNAQLVQMLQKQQEQMEEMQAKMQHANFQQNQMLKQQNAQMQAQMNAMKKQVEEQKAAQAAAQAKKAADEADIQKRREQIQAEIAAKQAAKKAKIESVEEVGQEQNFGQVAPMFVPEGFQVTPELPDAGLFGASAPQATPDAGLFGAPTPDVSFGAPAAPIEQPVVPQAAPEMPMPDAGLFGAPVEPVASDTPVPDANLFGMAPAAPSGESK